MTPGRQHRRYWSDNDVSNRGHMGKEGRKRGECRGEKDVETREWNKRR